MLSIDDHLSCSLCSSSPTRTRDTLPTSSPRPPTARPLATLVRPQPLSLVMERSHPPARGLLFGVALFRAKHPGSLGVPWPWPPVPSRPSRPPLVLQGELQAVRLFLSAWPWPASGTGVERGSHPVRPVPRSPPRPPRSATWPAPGHASRTCCTHPVHEVGLAGVARAGSRSSAIPAIAGTSRLVQASGWAHLLPDNARIAASSAPALALIIHRHPRTPCVGAFQFPSRRPRLRPGSHRPTAPLLVVLGTRRRHPGLWMTAFDFRQPGTMELAHCSGSAPFRARRQHRARLR